MPRVITRTKGSRGREYTCGRCGRIIKPGERYYHWEFRYGGKRIRCEDHYPRASELTQSKLSEVYAAAEELDDVLGGDALDVDDVSSAIEQAAERVRGVADEYREAAEAMGDAGYENEERADLVEQYADELDAITLPDVEAEDEDNPTEQELTDWRDAVRQEVTAVEFSG